jgi:signal transduction histidine kinase
LDVGTPRFSPDGEFKGYIGYAVDISDRKQKEDNERIVAHLQRLAALGELAAAMAHELRQPLAASITNAEVAQSLLSAGNPPLEELRDIISEIFGANRRAAEVISRIRDLTIKGEPRIEPLDLNSAVSDAVRLIASEASRRRIRLHVEFADGLPLVLGDGVQLQQVLINLAMNGMDAMTNTPEQARHLTIETRQNGSGYVEVIVVDRGTGIAPDTLPHLFESFFTTKEGGLGLGLTISRSIIDRHRGRIWAENYPGGGAAFHFIVPVTKNRSATGTLNYQG